MKFRREISRGSCMKFHWSWKTAFWKGKKSLERKKVEILNVRVKAWQWHRSFPPGIQFLFAFLWPFEIEYSSGNSQIPEFLKIRGHLPHSMHLQAKAKIFQSTKLVRPTRCRWGKLRRSTPFREQKISGSRSNAETISVCKATNSFGVQWQVASVVFPARHGPAETLHTYFRTFRAYSPPPNQLFNYICMT